MRLVSLELENFKRFEDKTKIDLFPSVVALIGPNEAGKSSILAALQFLNGEEKVSPGHRSRGTDNDVSIRGTFLLDREDKLALAGIRGGKNVEEYRYECRLEGKQSRYYYTFIPNPQRDLSSRKRRAKELTEYVERESVLARFRETNNVRVRPAYEGALTALRSTRDSLTQSETQVARRFADTMLRFPGIESVGSQTPGHETVSAPFLKLLRELQNYDEGRSPSQEVAAILGQRRPQFQLFTEEDRNLQTMYPVEAFSTPPRALHNIAQLAELDLDALRACAEPSGAGQRASILTRANQKLSERFKDVWPQHDLTVFLSFNQPNLEITLSAPDGEYSLVTERSDGLRSFVALRAFLANRNFATKPILLVDEAETHLHYDAQANLVDMFTKQVLAAKVIYSTHSAGCLPMDLGNGVRVVAPIPGKERSSVRKSIWDGKFAGFSPLVFAMGARTFAFLPARSVLLTEGESDSMVLPTLMREALGKESLRFQVAPGISNVSSLAMEVLSSEAGTVLYLVDGDGGGCALRKALLEAGTPANQVISLADYFETNTVLEDLINLPLCVEAINVVLSRYYSGAARVVTSDLTAPNRIESLGLWCEAHQVDAPSKTAVCQVLLDRKNSSMVGGTNLQLLDNTRKSGLSKLARHLLSRFPKLPEYGD